MLKRTKIIYLILSQRKILNIKIDQMFLIFLSRPLYKKEIHNTCD